ncbi:hypothetical protein A8U91_04238 [Halomonas elongata]|uniref:Uncharacterized protein n=1 Tax=Halomonas elongata TaxID=2746 RepID=A0A1B8NYR4_HALEL|nr:hypothetical protein [Halomonas elongata]OBX35167.1 hypothetical protein A8U91_04238 [Halomonas elongata]
MAMTASLEAESIDKETAFSLRAFDISSKWVHEGEARFVASAYQEGAIRAHDLIEKSEYPKKRLSELVSSVYHPTQSQPRSNFKRIWVSRGYGEPFLTGRDLFFFRPEEKKFVSRRMKKLHELKLPENTILLTRSGTTGYPVLVGKRLSKFAITDDALRVFPGSAPVGFIYAYLASWFGHALMTKSAYGATVPHLEAAHVLSLEVPMPPDEIIEEVSSSIVRAYSMRDEANILLDDAEEELYKACGSGAFHVDSDVQYSGKEGVRAFSASSTDVGTRFDPKFHIPVVRSAVNKLTSSGCELVSLRKCTNKIFIPARFKRNMSKVVLVSLICCHHKCL